MTSDQLNELNKLIENVSANFVHKAWAGNIEQLKDTYDINNNQSPNYYRTVIDSLEEVTR